MIDHLLDGTHLDTLAMNGPGGLIYLYRHGQGDTAEVYESASDLPELNYRVELNPLPLWWWEKKFIWGDDIEILDNRSGERIAFSNRYMGYSPRMIVVNAVGADDFEGGGHVGEKLVYYFDDRILFSKVKIRRKREI